MCGIRAATQNQPSLKKLTLSDVEVSQLSLDQIIACSPGLEDLNFINCERYFKLIDSKVLKSLMLDGFIDGDDRFTIAAPHLIHFEYLGCALEDICWRERPSLESAHIDTCGPTFYWNSIVCQDTYIIEFPRFRRKGMLLKRQHVFSPPVTIITLNQNYLESMLFTQCVYFFCAYLVFDNCCYYYSL